jgi:hypothetical protein
MIELEKASQFLDSQARLIDRRRFDLLFGDGEPEAAVAALAGYANADGGFGWALHPDLRSPGSQPVAAIHAFEVFEEIAPLTSPLAASLCDWLDQASLADGGLPFALPGAATPGSAPMWAGADPSRSSLLITSAVCGVAHRVAGHDTAVAEHRWLARVTDYCLGEIAAMDRPSMAIEFRFALQLLDALHDKDAGAAGQLERLGAFLPTSGTMPVEGGAEDEKMRPLDFSPEPDRPLRTLLAAEVIADDLDRLAAQQPPDGGWDVDWMVYSPAATLEWRGDATVRALKILKANGRLDRSAAGMVRPAKGARAEPG